MNQGPLILIPIAAAQKWRDEGMRFARLQTGMLAGMLGGVIAAMLGILALKADWSAGVLTAAIGSAICIILAGVCGVRMRFPHCATVDVEDFVEMQLQGVPEQMVEATRNSVLHGRSGDAAASAGSASVIPFHR